MSARYLRRCPYWQDMVTVREPVIWLPHRSTPVAYGATLTWFGPGTHILDVSVLPPPVRLMNSDSLSPEVAVDHCHRTLVRFFRSGAV